MTRFGATQAYLSVVLFAQRLPDVETGSTGLQEIHLGLPHRSKHRPDHALLTAFFPSASSVYPRHPRLQSFSPVILRSAC
jgi:hypothetical protein